MKTWDFHLTNSQVILSIKAIVVIGAILTIYAQDLLIVANEALNSELMSYVLAIPFLFAFIIYRKRKMLRNVIPFETTERIASMVPKIFLLASISTSKNLCKPMKWPS